MYVCMYIYSTSSPETIHSPVSLRQRSNDGGQDICLYRFDIQIYLHAREPGPLQLHTHTHTHTHTHIYIYIYLYIYIYIYIYICVCVCVWMCIYVFAIRIYLHVCEPGSLERRSVVLEPGAVYLYIFLYLFVYIYLYICICRVNPIICIHIFAALIYLHVRKPRSLQRRRVVLEPNAARAV